MSRDLSVILRIGGRVAAAALGAGLSAGCVAVLGASGEGDESSAADAETAPEPMHSPSDVEREECSIVPARLWKLTPLQFANTLESLVPSVSIDVERLEQTAADSGRFTGLASSRSLTVPHVESLIEAADVLMDELRQNPGYLGACLEAAPPWDEGCIRASLEDFGAKAFRRAMTSEETDELVAFYSGELEREGLAAEALVQAASAIVLSPHSLFRWEVPEENGAQELSAMQKSEALAYLLTDHPPDSTLREAGASGALDESGEIESQVRRLLETREDSEAVVRFFDELLRLEDVLRADKDPDLFPGFDQIRPDLLIAARRFVEHTVWQEGGGLERLLTSDQVFMNSRLADFYGASGPFGEDFSQVQASGPSAGVLTQPAFLAAHAREDETDIIRRGLFVREDLLCSELPAPPPDVDAFPPSPDGKNTHRERLSVHSENKACATCHQFMDPVGFAFESFDAAGRYRTNDEQVGKPIDPSGYLLHTESGESIQFDDAGGLGNALAASAETYECFARHLNRFGEGRGDAEGISCGAEELSEVLRTGSLVDAIAHMLSQPEFWQRGPMSDGNN